MLLPYDPSPTQKAALRKWADHTTEEIVFGGNKGGGKSNLGGACIFHDALVYPETRYFIAREVLKDLRLHTIPTINELFSLWKIDIKKYAPFNAQDNYFKCYNGSIVQLLECAYMPSDPLYERFGSMQWTRGWIEEGGEVSELAYTNLKLGIGRWKNDTYNLLRKLLISCNPKKNWIKYGFVDPFKAGRLPANKAFIPSSVYDNKHRQKGYEKVLEELTGTARQRLLLGNWDYDSDEDCLINSEKILDLYTNSHIPDEGDYYITADVARFGKDKTVIVVWKGWRIIHVIVLEKKDTVEVTRQIMRMQMLYQIPISNVAVDDDGVGGGVVDQLPGCIGFVNNSTPLPNPSDNRVENYLNLKSQCYYMLADRINKGGMFIEFDLSSIIDNSTGKTAKVLLNEELEQVRKKEVDADKKLGVLPKDKVKEILGRSPDYSDALMMRNVFGLSLRYTWTVLE
jgi:phage terminase large subunit